MVRGYKSDKFPDHDQGLVLCWIQDGNVFYRQYAYFYGTYLWQPIEQLTDTGDIEFVQVHRLNDYRIGIVTQSKTENKWYITDRTYVSQAVPTELLRSSLYGLNKFIAMTKQEEANISSEAYSNYHLLMEEPQSDFTITFKYPKSVALFRETLDEWKKHLNVTVNSARVSVDDYDLTIEGATLHIHTHEPVQGTVKISWDRLSFLFYLDDNRFMINMQTSYSFTWLIWALKINIQPPDVANAVLTGSTAFSCVEVERASMATTDTLNTLVSGAATFEYTFVPPEPDIVYKEGSCADCENVTLTGTLTFTATVVGNQPI
jgi:hypothetical protein